ncbi:MAG: hypothetical protein RIT02_470 [Planctomycetota bacterium]
MGVDGCGGHECFFGHGRTPIDAGGFQWVVGSGRGGSDAVCVFVWAVGMVC